MHNLIQHFKKNIKGKDYVVGDIHGMFKHLYKTLQNIDFDFINDRLFSVGDLCDRGPDSPDIIQWLKYPWFIPVLGNHEEIILLYEAKMYNDYDLKNVGASWWLTLPMESKKIILKAYKELPIALDVETEDGLVGIIHAECPHADWNKLEDLLTGINGARMINRCLWSTMSPMQSDIIQNVKAVIVGHMTQKEYIVRGNVHLIDTGAVYPQGHFTILELDTLFPVREFA
jgi:serine/threonine protein phosphatase 1